MGDSGLRLPPGITEQHGHIAQLIRSLRAARERGDTRDQLVKMLDGVLDSVRQHFEDEEAAMAKAAYPLLDEHRNAHATFVRRIRVLRDECDHRETELMGMFIELLDSWFKNHERTADAQVLAFLGGTKPS